MDDEARVLLDMFPLLPEQVVLTVWKNCGNNFAEAVDEALTVSSLGSFDREAKENDTQVPSNTAPAALQDLLRPETSTSPVANGQTRPTSIGRQVRDRQHTRRSSVSSRVSAPAPPRASEASSQKLPWESQGKYVLDSGELGLLSELQMPRRGAIVQLSQDFLKLPNPRAPSTSEGGNDGEDSKNDVNSNVAMMAPEKLIDLVDDSDDGDATPVQLSPMMFPSRGLRHDEREGPGEHSGERSGTEERAPSYVQGLGDFETSQYSASPIVELVTSTSNGGTPKAARNGAGAKSARNGAGAKSAGGRLARSKSTQGRGGPESSPVHDVETASAAERIAAFPPGTRFRVAVDKGVTGLGITVKEFRGRFFVYRLQTLADGSPGAAEEAGIRAGDEILGVEELDFEVERWSIDQLVSYMGELIGVVILYVMRGHGPLPQAPRGEEESGMSRGLARRNDGLTAGSEGGGFGRWSATRRMKSRAKRLLEVLEEENLTQASEAADVSRLYCQMTDRAVQWDTGELWLSVADMARRPPKETLVALAEKWDPGEPVGWEESDSSGGDSPPLSADKLSLTWPKGSVSLDPSSSGGGASTKHDAADLDNIGEALLGRPLFTDPLDLREIAEVAAAGDRIAAASAAERGGRCWSPWPQLAALESRTSRRKTVVPTQGLRKALSVRILGEGSGTFASGASGKHDEDLRSVPYVIWVMDVESGAEWRVRRCHAEFAELREVCTGMRPSLARLDFPSSLPNVKETAGIIEARRPRLEAYLQRLCSLLYMGPLHPSSAHVAHLLQDFLGTSPRVETLERLQRSRPERELRQALQVRAWQVLRLPQLERAAALVVREVLEGSTHRGKKSLSTDAMLQKITDIIERLQYVVTEGCFDELRDMVRRGVAKSNSSAAEKDGKLLRATHNTPSSGHDLSKAQTTADGVVEAGRLGEDVQGAHADIDDLAAEDEALELISGSVRRQVEAEIFVPVMESLYAALRAEGATARLEKAVAAGVEAVKGKPQTFHGIPLKSLSPSSWLSVSKLLHAMDSFTLPCDKLDALVAVAHAIPALYKAEHPGDDTDNLGADDFLPIFIFVLVNCQVEGVVAQSVVLEKLCDPKKIMGEAGFCVATLSAALQHLSRASPDQTRKGSMYGFLGRRV